MGSKGDETVTDASNEDRGRGVPRNDKEKRTRSSSKSRQNLDLLEVALSK